MSHSYPHLTSGTVGPVGFDDMNALFAAVHEISALMPQLRRIVRRSKAQPPRLWFFGEITGNVLIPGAANRWLYSWREVAWNANDWVWNPIMSPGAAAFARQVSPPATDPADPPPPIQSQEINSTIAGDQFALAAVNGVEHRNTGGDGVPGNANGIIGPGVDIDDQDYIACDLEPFPISNGVVVPIFTLHGGLASSQVTSGRSPVCYMFSLGNAHGKVQP